MLQLSRRVALREPGRGGTPSNLAYNPVYTLAEPFYILERRHVYRHQKLSVTSGARPFHHVPQLGSEGRPGQQRRQRTHHDRQTHALVSARRLQEPFERARRIRRRRAIRIESPTFRYGQTFLVVHANLTVRGGAEGR